MQYDLCRQIRTNGRRCHSPSLKGGIWCFFHASQHRSHRAFRHTDATRGYLIPGQHIELAPIEDRDSVQLALSMVINALAVGQLDPKRANSLLYGLQLASYNASRVILPHAVDVVRETETSEEGIAIAEPETHEFIPFDPAQEQQEEEALEDSEESGEEAW